MHQCLLSCKTCNCKHFNCLKCEMCYYVHSHVLLYMYMIYHGRHKSHNCLYACKIYFFYINCTTIIYTIYTLNHLFIKIASIIQNWITKELSFMIIFLQANSRKLYELCLSAIQMYSKHNLGRSNKNVCRCYIRCWHDNVK